MGDEIKNQKKRKGKLAYYGAKKFKNNSYGSLDLNQKGFIVTCNNREKEALFECYNILNRLKPLNKQPEANNEISENVDDDLKQELEELKSEQAFKQMKTKCKNIIFVKLKDEHDPNDLMNYIFSTIQTDQTINCRFICKMIPILKTVNVSKKCIVDGLEELLKLDQDDDVTFRVELIRRNNSKIVRDDLINDIGQLVKTVKPSWKVELKNPKKTIYIDILNKISCLTILDDFNARNKYNLNLFCQKTYDKTDEKNDKESQNKNDLNKNDENELEETKNVESNDEENQNDEIKENENDEDDENKESNDKNEESNDKNEIKSE